MQVVGRGVASQIPTKRPWPLQPEGAQVATFASFEPYRCHEGGDNCNEHKPNPPPNQCTKFCSPKAMQTCAELGMHCNCGDKLYNTTGQGLPHGESCSATPGCTGKCAPSIVEA